MKKMRFKKFVGPWINNQGVGVYEDEDGGRFLVAETSAGKNISEPVKISTVQLDEITSDPYNDAQNTITALQYCGVDV